MGIIGTSSQRGRQGLKRRTGLRDQISGFCVGVEEANENSM
jgi:hypothetical protein